jgi:SAM-dependent methyltransferase
MDCGPLPICNRFLLSAGAEESVFPITLGQCQNCGHLQLTRHPSVAEICPRFEWITYREPHEHLAELLQKVSRLPGIRRESRVGTIVASNDPTRERFAELGMRNVSSICPGHDESVPSRNPKIETVHAELTPEAAERIVAREGTFDIIVVRHVLEHAHDLRGFLAVLRQLVRPGGYLVFEVPDCEPAFASLDYSVLWEEHIHYFFAETFRGCFEHCGLSVQEILRPTCSLVAIVRHVGDGLEAKLAGNTKSLMIENARKFARGVDARRKTTRTFLSRFRVPGRTIALFGAGHQGCVFVNLLSLKDRIDIVIDDHPNKRGLFMPGSRLPIIGAREAVGQNIALCLSALSLESERQVFSRNPEFAQSRCEVMSIYPGRPNSLPIGT